MTEPTRPTCESCLFWLMWPAETEDLHANFEIDDVTSAGHCRRFPPALDYENGSLVRLGTWHYTLNDEWCGEHPDFPAYIAALKEHQRYKEGYS